MARWQILSLLRDYCRNMLYTGKTVGEAERFLGVLRAYLTEKEFWQLFQDLKNLESDLAGETRTFNAPSRPPAQFVLPQLWIFLGFLIFPLLLYIENIQILAVFWAIWLPLGWVLNRWGWHLLPRLRRTRRGITPQRRAELIEPQTAVAQFIEFFEEEKARQARKKEEKKEKLQEKLRKIAQKGGSPTRPASTPNLP